MAAWGMQTAVSAPRIHITMYRVRQRCLWSLIGPGLAIIEFHMRLESNIRIITLWCNLQAGMPTLGALFVQRRAAGMNSTYGLAGLPVASMATARDELTLVTPPLPISGAASLTVPSSNSVGPALATTGPSGMNLNLGGLAASALNVAAGFNTAAALQHRSDTAAGLQEAAPASTADASLQHAPSNASCQLLMEALERQRQTQLSSPTVAGSVVSFPAALGSHPNTLAPGTLACSTAAPPGNHTVFTYTLASHDPVLPAGLLSSNNSTGLNGVAPASGFATIQAAAPFTTLDYASIPPGSLPNTQLALLLNQAQAIGGVWNVASGMPGVQQPQQVRAVWQSGSLQEM